MKYYKVDNPEVIYASADDNKRCISGLKLSRGWDINLYLEDPISSIKLYIKRYGNSLIKKDIIEIDIEFIREIIKTIFKSSRLSSEMNNEFYKGVYYE